MRVLMLGWEFPPFISGGLGTACFGMTKALARQGIKVLFVLPHIKGDDRASHVNLISASDVPLHAAVAEDREFLANIDFRTIDTLLRPYLDDQSYARVLSDVKKMKYAKEKGPDVFIELSGDYGGDLISEAIRYARVVAEIARKETFDVIHGHDWLTAFAGAAARRVSGRPFVYHAHALEYDRSGENINGAVYDIERLGMTEADEVIAVSHYTKNMIVNRYGIDPGKVTVVHNAVNREMLGTVRIPAKRQQNKIVLFLGRVTFQKGPDYFIEAAALVLKYMRNVTFVMAGTGDMWPRMIERVAQLRIGKNFHFLGFVEGAQIEQIYGMSDLYVMPSISEPFGISPLEAMLRDVPVIISKQSGVSEIVDNVLKVDFWNVRDLANKIISVLTYPALSVEMVQQSRESLRSIYWENAAQKISSVYNRLSH